MPSVAVRGKSLKLYTAKTTLSAAQVLASFTTPIAIVAAPGANKAIVVHRVTAYLDYGSAAYATNTTMEVRYTNGSGTKVSADIASLLAATADKIQSVGGIEAETTLTANAAVVIRTATGNPVTGDSPIYVSVDYSIVEL